HEVEPAIRLRGLARRSGGTGPRLLLRPARLRCGIPERPKTSILRDAFQQERRGDELARWPQRDIVRLRLQLADRPGRLADRPAA
ncbi:unnamed protein product, partial [Ectocarpus sp. 12 AP-2014]